MRTTQASTKCLTGNDRVYVIAIYERGYLQGNHEI